MKELKLKPINSNDNQKPSKLLYRRAQSHYDRENVFSEFGKDISEIDIEGITPVIIGSQNSNEKLPPPPQVAPKFLDYKNLPLTPPKLDQKTLDRQKKFEFTEPSKYEKAYHRTRKISRFLFRLYLLAVSIFIW